MGIKLPSFKRLFESDFDKEYQDLIAQLATTINSGFEPIYEILNGKFSITTNTNSLIKEVLVEVDIKGKPKTKVSIAKDGTDRFEGIAVIQAENLTNSKVYPTAAPFITYTETSTTITIDNVAGLPADNIFRLKLFGIR